MRARQDNDGQGIVTPVLSETEEREIVADLKRAARGGDTVAKLALLTWNRIRTRPPGTAHRPEILA